MSRYRNELSSVLNTLNSTIENINNVCDPNHVKGVKGLPRAFVEVAKWLPVLKTTLDNSKQQLQERSNKEETQEIKNHYQQLALDLRGCKEKAEKLEVIFKEVLYVEGQSASDRYQDVAEPGERVEQLMIDALNGALELAKAPVCLINEDEAQKLQQGLNELGKLPPSLVEDKAGNVATNRGSGTQINHFGKGNQYHNDSKTAPMMIGTFQSPVNFHHGPQPAPTAPTAEEKNKKPW